MQKVAPDIWEQMQSLFHLSADKSDEEMEAVLLETCPDPDLRAEVRLLVQASRTPLEESPAEPGAESAQRSRFGGYRVLRHLGTGGTGSVYLVEWRTGGSLQKAALKVFPGYDTESFFSRSFAREESILAALTHPSIPRLLDVGVSETGEPFLVMDFAEGEPLDVFCDARELGVEARLRLMLKVCDAVSYAHRNLVVHLDLKPSNLLAREEEPQIKLLDFGTSKLLEAGRTLAIAHMATPAYAAPEQLRGEPTTTSCDVFALGAILFDLLAGRRAFPDASLAAVAERSEGETPAHAVETAVTDAAAHDRGTSTAALRRRLRGDLSTIVAKCLAPAPEDRYASVDALGEDLRRHLAGMPILASSSKGYRLRKFLRRHAVAVASTAAVILLLGILLGYVAQRNRAAAREAARASELHAFVYALLVTANPEYTGKPAATVTELLAHTADVLPQYLHQGEDLRAAQLALADSMIDDGDRAGAEKVLDTVRKDAEVAKDFDSLVEADAFLSRVLAQDGHREQSLALSQQALTLASTHKLANTEHIWADIAFAEARENPGEHTDANLAKLREAVQIAHEPDISGRLRAEAQYALASDLELRGEMAEAESLIRDNLSIYSREPNTQCHQSQMYADLGFITGSRGDTAGSVALLQQAFDGARACRGPDAHDTLLIQDYLAGALLHADQPARAEQLMLDALPRWQNLHAGGVDLANALFYAASSELAAGDLRKADATGKELLAEVHQAAPAGSHMVGSSEKVVAETLMREGRYAEALPHAELAAAVLQHTATSPATTEQAQKMAAESAEIRRRVSRH